MWVIHHSNSGDTGTMVRILRPPSQLSFHYCLLPVGSSCELQCHNNRSEQKYAVKIRSQLRFITALIGQSLWKVFRIYRRVWQQGGLTQGIKTVERENLIATFRRQTLRPGSGFPRERFSSRFSANQWLHLHYSRGVDQREIYYGPTALMLASQPCQRLPPCFLWDQHGTCLRRHQNNPHSYFLLSFFGGVWFY